jgi:hypothetical protein
MSRSIKRWHPLGKSRVGNFKPRKAALLRFVEDLTCLLDFATFQVVSAFDVFYGKFVRRDENDVEDDISTLRPQMFRASTSVKIIVERSPATLRTKKGARLSAESHRPSKKPSCRSGRFVMLVFSYTELPTLDERYRLNNNYQTRVP